MKGTLEIGTFKNTLLFSKNFEAKKLLNKTKAFNPAHLISKLEIEQHQHE